MTRRGAGEFEAAYTNVMASREAVVLTQSGLLKNRYDSVVHGARVVGMPGRAALTVRLGDYLEVRSCCRSGVPGMFRIGDAEAVEVSDPASGACRQVGWDVGRQRTRNRGGCEMKRVVLCFAVLVGCACVVAAQAPPAGTQAPAAAAQIAPPLTTETKQAADRVANNLLRMAEKMPEEFYAFQPVPEIRTFAGTLGHTIDMRMRTCAGVTGSGTQLIASNMKAKADLVAAMKSSIAECDIAFAGLTDATVVQMSTGGRGGPRSRLSSLYAMVAHDNEEYGYLAVHLRLKGIVPPSSEGGPMK